MKAFSQKRSAYTLLELVFVIVILGIISSIGSEIIAKVYDNYIMQRALHRASSKTELAALQIANRLRYAIPGTIYRIKNDGSLESVESALVTAGNTYKGLLWVGYDGDSFEAVSGSAATAANRRPGWSGFVDVNDTPNTTINRLKSGASNLNLTDTIIQNLNYSGKDITNAYIYFPEDPNAYKISAVAGDSITLASNASKTIREHYKLAWSSYALVVVGGDLMLYYDFPATSASDYTQGKNKLLLKNVTNFKFKGAGRTVRFKLCLMEKISSDLNISACKEKAVF